MSLRDLHDDVARDFLGGATWQQVVGEHRIKLDDLHRYVRDYVRDLEALCQRMTKARNDARGAHLAAEKKINDLLKLHNDSTKLFLGAMEKVQEKTVECDQLLQFARDLIAEWDNGVIDLTPELVERARCCAQEGQ